MATPFIRIGFMCCVELRSQAKRKIDPVETTYWRAESVLIIELCGNSLVKNAPGFVSVSYSSKEMLYAIIFHAIKQCNLYPFEHYNELLKLLK